MEISDGVKMHVKSTYSQFLISGHIPLHSHKTEFTA